MNELDAFWQTSIAQAIENAKANNRSDVVDYLTLKATNDQIRLESSRWLFESFHQISHDFIKKGINIEIENKTPHSFEAEKAKMVGFLLRFKFGIRQLEIEAGWTRTPADGFMRRNALAFAQILHFGMQKKNSKLILLKTNEIPTWFVLDDEQKQTKFGIEEMKQHFQTFIG